MTGIMGSGDRLDFGTEPYPFARQNRLQVFVEQFTAITMPQGFTEQMGRRIAARHARVNALVAEAVAGTPDPVLRARLRLVWPTDNEARLHRDDVRNRLLVSFADPGIASRLPERSPDGPR